MSNKTLFVEVEGIGSFEFAPRTGEKSLAVATEFHRLTKGQEISGMAGYMIDAVAHLKALTKSGPEGWDLDAMDYWSEEDGARVIKAFEGWKAEYARFRGIKPAEPQAESENTR